MPILEELPGILADAAGDILFKDATLSRDGKGTGPAWNPGRGETQTWRCKALVTEWGDTTKTGGLVAAQDRKVLILAATLATTPKTGDRVSVDGVSYTITPDGGSAPAVQSDPANATWACRGRG